MLNFLSLNIQFCFILKFNNLSICLVIKFHNFFIFSISHWEFCHKHPVGQSVHDEQTYSLSPLSFNREALSCIYTFTKVHQDRPRRVLFPFLPSNVSRYTIDENKCYNRFLIERFCSFSFHSSKLIFCIA